MLLVHIYICLCWCVLYIVYALKGRRVRSLFWGVCLDEGLGEGWGLGVEGLVR